METTRIDKNVFYFLVVVYKDYECKKYTSIKKYSPFYGTDIDYLKCNHCIDAELSIFNLN